MRQGELLGLRWSDIDFEGKTVTIQRTAYYLIGRRVAETSPKTTHSRRTITLAGFALEALKRHRTAQLKARMEAVTWADKDLVFCDEQGDYFFAPVLRPRFLRFLQQAGLKVVRFHDLRHSTATLLLKLKIDIEIIQAVLGHSSIQMTLKYLHVLAAMSQDVATQLDALLGSDYGPEREAK